MRRPELFLLMVLLAPTTGRAQAADSTALADTPSVAVLTPADSAIVRLEAAVRADSNQVGTLLDLAAAYREADRENEAGALLRRLSERFPKDAVVWNEWGLFLLDQDAADEALAAFGRAVTIKPRDPIYRLNRGLVRLDADDATGALADFDAGLAVAPERDSLMVGRAQALVSLNRLAEAVKALGGAVKRKPDEADYHGQLADLLRQMKRPTEARAEAETARRLDPDEPSYWLTLGLTYRDERNYVRADTLLRAAVKAMPTSAVARFELAQVQSGLNRWRTAVALYNQALDLGYEDEAEAQYRIGLLYYLGDKSSLGFAAARDAFEAAVEADPDARKVEIARYLKDIDRELTALNRLNRP